MTNQELKNIVRNIPHFPIHGIQFKDITPLFQNPESLQALTRNIASIYQDKGITKVVGIESRGFIMAPIAALELQAGFVPIRKPGKLPYSTIEEKYTKEYGTDAIQIHTDALCPNDVVLIHDDLLATGGTMLAAYNLIKRIGVKKVYINFIMELEDLKGREIFPEDVEITSLFSFPI